MWSVATITPKQRRRRAREIADDALRVVEALAIARWRLLPGGDLPPVVALTGEPELAATLLAYFDCNQNAKTTAQRLEIHVNTVRQRLATIEDLLGHWGHASRALELHLAVRLWSLGTPRG